MFPRKKNKKFQWKKFYPTFLAFFILSRRTILLPLVQTTTSTEKGVATDSLIFPIPLLSAAMTIDEISPGDKRTRGRDEGWNKCREKDRLTACALGRASRQKNEEYISIRSLLSNSSPFGIPPFLLFPLSLSFVAFSRKKSRRNLPFLPAQETTHVPRITVFFFLVKGPLDGMDQVRRGGKSCEFFLIEAIWSGFWICLFTRYNSVCTNVSSFFLYIFSRVIFYFIVTVPLWFITMKGNTIFLFFFCHLIISKMKMLVVNL